MHNNWKNTHWPAEVVIPEVLGEVVQVVLHSSLSQLHDSVVDSLLLLLLPLPQIQLNIMLKLNQIKSGNESLHAWL